MDVHDRIGVTDFVWNAAKAAGSWRQRGIRFEDAATVFMDPLLVFTDVSRKNEARDAVIGFDQPGRLLFVVHIEFEDECIRLIRRVPPNLTRKLCMLDKTLKQRLTRDWPVTSITLRIPVDVVDSLKPLLHIRDSAVTRPCSSPTSAKVCAATKLDTAVMRWSG